MQILKFKLLLCLSMFILSAQASSEKWETTVVEHANYSISFPGTPSPNFQQVETELGTLDLNMLILDGSAIGDVNYLYLVNVTTYPGDRIDSDNEETVEDFFIGIIEGASTNVDGELLSEEVITYKGYPGREIKVEYYLEDSEVALIQMRIYLVKNTTYMLQCMSPIDNPGNKSVKKFMKSFKLLD
jgi:hypothetical protein